ncbi:hypothetical protein EG344_04495 [Chryseobacterium sp. G0162]|uniref:hypothetical protein n=1 Tax=Chryseobacterium sp. G0162 TaxID=2487063 RepID=UPI000F4DEE11|nr:hypothetical protein [Chryseobacterium sp. G0162]AZB08167.1 hypothetical protein EG344_04495 [Chryseobacterium sp. G0162]
MNIKKIVLIVFILGMLSCNKSMENKPMTTEEKINTRDSTAVQGYFQQIMNHRIKDTISGTWKALSTYQFELFKMKLETVKNNDSVTGTYQFTAEGKLEQGIMTGIITDGKMIVEFYNPSNPNARKGKAELSSWNANYDEMVWQLIQSSEQSSIPEICNLYKDVPKPIRGYHFIGRKKPFTR